MNNKGFRGIHLRVGRDDATGHPVPLGPHLVHLTADVALAELDLLVQVDARQEQVLLQTPHLRASHVLVLERNLHRVQGHRVGTHRAHNHVAIVA